MNELPRFAVLESQANQPDRNHLPNHGYLTCGEIKVPSPSHPRRISRRGSADSHRNVDGLKNPNCLGVIEAAARGKNDHAGLANTTLSPYGPPDHRISQAEKYGSTDPRWSSGLTAHRAPAA